ncbi:hypothetical protein BC834DRAFT_549278 [Gloeopeniophorella convolvens]|nr:hypothetical protein BC834DRAFT_549278 [Gloeopeniophorella convolvens]
MNNPEKEIEKVVQRLTTSATPDDQRSAFQRYFTSDAGFRHPLCSVEPAHNSRDAVLAIFQWYRIMSPRIDLSVDDITYDAAKQQLFLNISQVFHIRFSPFPPAKTRLLTRLTLREEGGRYYIVFQEDFYHPDDFQALLTPPLVWPTSLVLRVGGFVSGIFARIAQAAFGEWRPRTDGGR